MKVYFDMDGVLADFTGGIQKLCGLDPAVQGESSEKEDDRIWDAVRSVEHFYDRLDPMPGSIELFLRLYAKYGDDCQILTAVPKPERNILDAGPDKLKWVKRLIPSAAMVNIVLRKEKPNYCSGLDSILIDDYDKNIREWEAIGGTGMWRSPNQMIKKRTIL